MAAVGAPAATLAAAWGEAGECADAGVGAAAGAGASLPPPANAFCADDLLAARCAPLSPAAGAPAGAAVASGNDACCQCSDCCVCCECECVCVCVWVAVAAGRARSGPRPAPTAARDAEVAPFVCRLGAGGGTPGDGVAIAGDRDGSMEGWLQCSAVPLWHTALRQHSVSAHTAHAMASLRSHLSIVPFSVRHVRPSQHLSPHPAAARLSAHSAFGEAVSLLRVQDLDKERIEQNLLGGGNYVRLTVTNTSKRMHGCAAALLRCCVASRGQLSESRCGSGGRDDGGDKRHGRLR